jgi:hypothetical protein
MINGGFFNPDFSPTGTPSRRSSRPDRNYIDTGRGVCYNVLR